ncbi:MAG: AhpC/TSA family protein [Planctomycetaceae bacterium]|nr:AhpC/TSA family protein [Planctomycetaceae bacterium]
MPDEAKKLFQEKAEELAQSGLAERGLRVGDMAPDFLRPDAWGNPVRLGELLREGPVVLSFYRGGWCPYCNLELRALQQNLPEFQKRGGKLVAISPNRPTILLQPWKRTNFSFWC